MGRKQTADGKRLLSPSRLPLRAHWERERRLGTRQHLNDMGTRLSQPNRSIDPDRLSCLESFPTQKLLIFLNFVSLYKCLKSVTKNNWKYNLVPRAFPLVGKQRTTRAEIYTNTHMPQFFQSMLLNSKFLHKKVRFKWTFVLSDQQKNKGDSRANLLFLT